LSGCISLDGMSAKQLCGSVSSLWPREELPAHRPSLHPGKGGLSLLLLMGGWLGWLVGLAGWAGWLGWLAGLAGLAGWAGCSAACLPVTPFECLYFLNFEELQDRGRAHFLSCLADVFPTLEVMDGKTRKTSMIYSMTMPFFRLSCS